ncbi:MAG: exodeoxyribonuclease VII small subunit, partial [Planctomycetota bacterium]|nr:exodeoxyribonuclease VII small subunit [Planctomycetota bacterium]
MNTPQKKKEGQRTPKDGTLDETPLSFDEAMQRLEKIVAQLQSNDLPLERGIELYEEGIRYAKRCQQTLSRAEQRIDLLVAIGPDGQAQTTPFEDQGAGADLTEKAARRSDRRSTSSRPAPPPPDS